MTKPTLWTRPDLCPRASVCHPRLDLSCLCFHWVEEWQCRPWWVSDWDPPASSLPTPVQPLDTCIGLSKTNRCPLSASHSLSPEKQTNLNFFPTLATSSHNHSTLSKKPIIPKNLLIKKSSIEKFCAQIIREKFWTWWCNIFGRNQKFLTSR